MLFRSTENGKVDIEFDKNFLANVDLSKSSFGATAYLKMKRVKSGTVQNKYTNSINNIDFSSNTVTTTTEEPKKPETPPTTPKKPETPVTPTETPKTTYRHFRTKPYLSAKVKSGTVRKRYIQNQQIIRPARPKVFRLFDASCDIRFISLFCKSKGQSVD